LERLDLMPTQKERILNSLKAAGGLGVRSDVYIRDFMPRAAARVAELRAEGFDISSEPEDGFTRWTLTEGRRSGSSGSITAKPASRVNDRSQPAPSSSSQDHHDPAAPAYGSVKSASPSAESDSEHPGGPESLFSIPSVYDPWESAA
jgi:hypothetical protein